MNTAILKEAKYLKTTVSIVKELAKECKVSFKQGECRISTMSTTNVAHLLTTYTDCDCEKEFSLYLDMAVLDSAIKKADDKDVLKIEVDDDLQTCEITYNKPRLTKNRIGVLDETGIAGAEPKPKDFKIEVLLETKDLYDAVEDARDVGESIVFFSSDDFWIMARAPVGARKYETMLPILKHTKSEPTQCKYNAEYLLTFLAAKKLYNVARIEYSASYPLQLFFTDEKSTMRGIIAPIVEND